MAQKGAHSQRRDVAPLVLSEYLNPEYWNQRFLLEEHYEWFKDYSYFRHLILEHVKPFDSVLELGCGNSNLSEELYNDVACDVTCTDLSAVAVDKMRKRLRAKGHKGIKVLEANMLCLPFESGSFDVVIEKGTMDVLFVDSCDPWNPKAETIERVITMLEGINRVLKLNGTFISITFGQPHFRRPFLEAPQFTWSVAWSTFGDEFRYFFYYLKKGEQSLVTQCPSQKCDKSTIYLLQEELDDENYLLRLEVEELGS